MSVLYVGVTTFLVDSYVYSVNGFNSGVTKLVNKVP
jgi:hypothetical protein